MNVRLTFYFLKHISQCVPEIYTISLLALFPEFGARRERDPRADCAHEGSGARAGQLSVQEDAQVDVPRRGSPDGR